MNTFEHQGHEATGAPHSLPQDTVEIVGPDGSCLRFTRSDFEEFYTTSDARQMRRHLRAGWFLLDERVGRDAGQGAFGIDTAQQTGAGRTVAAQDDPQRLSREDVTTYVLGLLRSGASGMPVN